MRLSGTLRSRRIPAYHGPAPKSYNGLSMESLNAIRSSNLNPALTTHFKSPLLISGGSMQWLWDDSGKRYLDFFGGIVTVSVGHCHPKVVSALKEQSQNLWHTTNIYYNSKIHEYAQKLTSKLPSYLSSVYFLNSGSEANDLAMYLARLHTKNYDIISFRNGYHGMSPYTMGLTAHSPWKFHTFTGHGIHHSMNPDPYRGLWGGSHCRDSPIQTNRVCSCSEFLCSASSNYVSQFEEIVKYSLPKGRSLAAFFAESIQGVGGTVQFPKGTLSALQKRVHELGGLYVADEVQTGFGRTGEHFWGFEAHNVLPDIVTMAKGIGNGFPLAALVTTSEIAESLSHANHFNTFGGNPLASAVGIAVLDTIEEDKCQENSSVVGTYMLEKLGALRDKFDIIGDVRGKGLMIGIEMVTDKESKNPLSSTDFMSIWDGCKNEGLLLGKGGFYGNVFRIKPPMCITKEDVDFAVDVISEMCTKVNAGK